MGRLTGRRVLVPRGGEWGERVGALLEAEGAQAVVLPMLRFEDAPDVEDVDDAILHLAAGRYAWLTVTSATTVAALSARAVTVAPGTPADVLPRVLGGARVAAVGPGTARALERAGVTPDLVPTGERSARGLVAEFPAPAATPSSAAQLRVLAPHSDLAEPTLVDGLRAAGWQVDEVIAYRTVTGDTPDEAVRTAWRDGGFDAVLLSSASTVTALLELVGAPPAATTVCCIGPRTERAALDAGLAVHVRPAHASAEDMVEALATHLAEQAHDHDQPTPDPRVDEERP
ncbi:uroporphyrinogen-III synthase [Cellulomonas sp. APG4]|uniref:uroporphyrinogen-III synthase n=1 Tax=Cellulomonas sp. APG4 TaxID=1538656 RepID=UPI00137A338D|nr:uroporphyrinogen-III synthase [Cellulomonas sp. APG4]